ncbi:F-box only protein 3-like [Patiria miniata]|uniref:F-box protein 3 n=1 Tax=Patiria miniata TaxID=46514 RepID=A0A913Z619_PATMI|nr:F-box only protein 3-like [Patiria miniata]XP_038047169.1 F-box only protein 3-like [Patiria miniata]
MDSGEETVDFTSHLPDELLLLVLAHVSYKDLFRIGCVCQRLRDLSRSNFLWRRLCHVHWLDVPPVEDGGEEESPTVWYRTFQRSYRHLGLFIGCYSTLKGHWNRIEAALKERGAVDILETLRGPTQENEVPSEAQVLPIPADVLCSLHIHDGQETFYGDERMLGLGGLVRVYSFQSCPVLLSRRTMVSQLRELKDELAEERKGQLLHTVTVLECPLSRISIRMCLNSVGDFQTGNMFYCHHDYVLESSFGWPNEGYFLLAKSFTDWLAQLADRLSDPGTIFQQSSLTRFYLEPSCVAVTEHVKVSVATAFISEMSEKPLRPGRNMFAYYITMAMDENSPRRKSCKLRTRHWVIRDSNGRVETVDGAGVVGDFPIIQPGTSHSWASYTSFVTSAGSMGGHFGMVNLETQETFNVKCPDFHMKALPYLRLPEYSEEMVDDT